MPLLCKGPRSGPFAQQRTTTALACFYSATLAWNSTAVDTHSLATAEVATLRVRLLKVAARITETATRVRIALASACPDAGLFRIVARSLQPAGP